MHHTTNQTSLTNKLSLGGGGLLDSVAQLTDAGGSTRGRQWRLTLTVDIGGSTHDKQRRLAVGLTFEQEARSGLAELELAPAALGPPVRVVAEEDVVVVVDERQHALAVLLRHREQVLQDVLHL